MRGGWTYLFLAVAITAHGERATLPYEAGVGPEPALPPDGRSALLVADNVAKAVWRVRAAAHGDRPPH